MERRRAQNRIAQRNYRDRQRKRLALAESMMMQREGSSAGYENWPGEWAIDNSLPMSGDDDLDVMMRESYADLQRPSNRNAGPTPDLNSFDFGILDLNLKSSENRNKSSKDSINVSGTRGRSNDDEMGVSPVCGSPADMLVTRNSTAPVASPSIDSHTLNTDTSSSAPQVHTPSIEVADAHESDEDNYVPLLVAASHGHIKMVQLLAKSGADLEAKNKSGKTALCRAIERGHAQTAKVLLELGADITTTDGTRLGLVHKAIVKDDIAILKILLESCKDTDKRKSCLNMMDGRRRTPLYLAASLGKNAIAEL